MALHSNPLRRSDDFQSPQSIYYEHEATANSLSEIIDFANKVCEIDPNQPIFWRGQSDSRWGVHSNLYRLVAESSGCVLDPNHDSYDVAIQSYPREDSIQAAEKETLELLAGIPMMNRLNALDRLAYLQHHGAPTRLIDVSKSVLVASYFAVEDPRGDGRIFAFGQSDKAEQPNEMSDWNGRPFWFEWQNNHIRDDNRWGNGQFRRIWIPTGDDPRFSAQQAAFVLDGVPMSDQRYQSSFRKVNSSKPNDNWKMADHYSTGSVYMKFMNVDAGISFNSGRMRTWAPTYTLRIQRDAKERIKDNLNRLFGISVATLFPDFDGLSEFVRDQLKLRLSQMN